jgi:predicted O-methyltransferase YrrM
MAIEHDKAWYEQIRQKVSANVQIEWARNGHHYVDAIVAESKRFDLIVVDGEFRATCAERAVKSLQRDGAILLDNSDWHPEAATVLRNADLIEVDFFGFGPINDYTWTTSLFFTREFRPKFRSPRHPLPGPGALHNRATIHAP